LEISSSNLSFRITAVEVDALKPHEEVIDPVAKVLAEEMRVQGEVKDPLMVDREELVILDGMHRYQALKLLGCKFAPCCLFDYDDPKIRVGSWFRLFKLDEPEKIAQETLRSKRISFSKHNVGQFHLNPDALMLARGNIEFVASSNGRDPMERARTAVELEKSVTASGHHVDYLSESLALELLNDGRVDLVIPVPIFTKHEIRDFGLKGRLLPHKVTRHVIPSRPLHVDIPLGMLSDVPSRDEIERNVGQYLSKKRVELKQPGSVVDGRRYEEELLVFAS